MSHIAAGEGTAPRHACGLEFQFVKYRTPTNVQLAVWPLYWTTA